MKKYLKKSVYLAFLALPYFGMAQSRNGFIGKFKEIVNEQLFPILGIALVLAVSVGIVQNIEDLADKNGQGTRSKALINIAWIVAIAMASILAIIAIINFFETNQIQIG